MSPQARIAAGLGAALVLLLGSGVASYRSTLGLIDTAGAVADVQQLLRASSDLRAQLSAAESARRGFVLTGDERLAGDLGRAETAARTRQQEIAGAVSPTQARELGRLLDERMALLRETIALRRADPGAVQTQIERTDADRRASEAIGGVLHDIERGQVARAAAAQASARRSAERTLRVVMGGSTIAVLLIVGAFVLLWREGDDRRRAREARRRSEDLYRTVLSRLPNAAVVLFDHDLRYLLAGGDALPQVGLSRELLEGRTVREALPSISDQLEPMYRAALAGQENVFDVEYGGRVFATKAVPVRGEQGEVVAGMVLAMDVSEARESQGLVLRLNRDLEQGVTELTAANQELEAFSYSVSHDLRAPLRHISGFVDLLRRSSHDRLDEKGQRQLDTIARAARSMGELIDDLLAFSRVSRTRPHREPVDMAFLVREVVQPIRLENSERGVEWVIGDLPRVSADPSLLRIVLTNLIGNAVKYSRTQQHARIEIASRPAEDGQAVFHVRDNGVGFEMEYAGKLFGVFQRLHRADEFEGTGIGLATVRRIVNRHGGRTWAEGRPGEGATFYFTLPLAAEEPASPAADGPAERSA